MGFLRNIYEAFKTDNPFIKDKVKKVLHLNDPILIFASLYVITIPFFKVLPAIILGFWMIFSVFSYKWKKCLQALIKNKISILLIALYLLHLISFIFSSNPEHCLAKAQVKFSYIILPFLLAPVTGYNKNKLYSILSFFISGIVLSIIINFTLSAISFSINHNFKMFFYEHISNFHHPSYYALYITFSAMAILYLQNEKAIKCLKKTIIFLLIHLVMIFLISSKAGILVMLFLLIAESILRLFEKTNLKHLLIFIGSLGIVILSIFYNYRMASAINEINQSPYTEKSDQGSTNSRIQVWKTSVELISDNLFSGVATGNVNDILIKEYKENNYTKPANKRLNCHNQFLQTQLSLGITGSILLLLSFGLLFFPAKTGYKRIIFMFLSMVFINFLFESMLETQSGVQFIIFFLIFLSYLKQKNDDTFFSTKNR